VGADRDRRSIPTKEEREMDVKLKDVEAQLGTSGVLMEISRPNKKGAVGRLQVGKATLTWWKGGAKNPTKKVRMEDFIDWLNS
jgi:hypothetical protein